MEELSELTCRFAARDPVLEGVNVTCAVKVLPGVSVAGNDGKLTLKSEAFAPEISSFEIFRSAAPEFLIATGVASLVVCGT